MSDPPQPPPPKPKPGSLRDRIAAFERPSVTPAAPSRPPVRPKPGNVTWKPAPPSPTSVTSGNTTSEHEEQRHGGMSASDAKESIGRGGSLKERMAALQGKGAFGGGLPAGPPPLGPKPVKRPPLVVPQPPVSEEEENEKPHVVTSDEAHDETQSPDKPVENIAGEHMQKESNAEVTEEEQDEEAKERERRAAIASRMARLGGARVGMAPPPVFGMKPAVKPKVVTREEAKEEATKDTSLKNDSIPEPIRRDSAASAASAQSDEKIITSPNVADAGPGVITTEEVVTTSSGPEEPQPSLLDSASSHPSVDSSTPQVPVATSRTPPTFMPLPSAPRRTGPPRKRSAKNIKASVAKEEEEDQASIVPSPHEAHPKTHSTHTHSKEDMISPPTPEQSAHPESEEPSEDHFTGDRKATGDSVVLQESGSLSSAVEATQVEEVVEDTQQSNEDVSPVQDRERDESSVEIEVIGDVGSEGFGMHETVDVLDRDPAETEEESSFPDPAIQNEAEPPAQDHIQESTMDSGPTASIETERSSSLTPVPDPGNLGSADNITAEEQLNTPRRTMAEETEDEEVARKRRLAERLAKMGARNPFAANTIPAFPSAHPRTSSSDQDTLNTPESDGYSGVSRDDDDLPDPEFTAESMVASVIHDRDYVGPRATGVAKNLEPDVPMFEAPPEKHEEPGHEHKISPLASLSGPSLATVSFPEESTPPNIVDDMIPSRINRPVPSLPPQEHQVDQGNVISVTESQHASPGRSVPPPSALPPISYEPHKFLDADVGSEEDLIQQSPVADEDDSSPVLSSQRGDDVRDTPVRSPGSRREMSSGSHIVPAIPHSPMTSAEQYTTSEPPKRPIPPPVPQPYSPTPTRRSTSSSARAAPTPPSAPHTDPASFVTSVRRSTLPAATDVLPARRSPELYSAQVDSPEADPDDGTSNVNTDEVDEHEAIVEFEADPIDPSFHSPPRSPSTPRNRGSLASLSKEGTPEDSRDEDQARRQTIAERMARLGGIKFGAPPPVPVPRSVPVVNPQRPAQRVPSYESAEGGLDLNEEDEEAESEEAARARRQAISARLAGMGGMRFGMLPQLTPSVHPRDRSDESAGTAETPTQPPQTPPLHETSTSDADLESEDGVKVEAGSELSMEEVTEEDAVEEPEEVPPPVPSRQNRHLLGEVAPSSVEGRRYDLNVPRPPVLSTEVKHIGVSGSVRNASGRPIVPSAQPSDFVVVDGPGKVEEMRQPPPPRVPRPSQKVPPPTSPPRDMASSQWELPEVPMGSFDPQVGAGTGMESSFTSEDSTAYPATSSSPPSVPRPPQHTEPTKAAASNTEAQLSGEELLQLWNVVGTAVHVAASSLFDKSKKTVVGDGTSRGFVMAALAQVPGASKASYGHLIYSQNAHSVLRRLSNILPGDIIQLADAKLKGHKGLQSYSQLVGTSQEPFVAIVSDFDPKKSKVRVYQANQHVGAQTVETTSYRLEDLKSGNIKVFRVARA